MSLADLKLQEMGKKKRSPWWNQGVRFECQQSGNCCTSRGQYGYVYLTRKDRKNLAEFFKMTTREFTKMYCARTDGYYHLVENGSPDCIYLSEKKCTVYEARPTQCRTWPFWPENMSAKAGVAQFSRFVLVSEKESSIQRNSLANRSKSKRRPTWSRELDSRLQQFGPVADTHANIVAHSL